jgi:hypothetical protein
MRPPVKDSDVERKHRNDERNETAPKEQGLIHQTTSAHYRTGISETAQSGGNSISAPVRALEVVISRSVRLQPTLISVQLQPDPHQELKLSNKRSHARHTAFVASMGGVFT